MNRIRLVETDESIDARLKAYMQFRAVRYLPWHMYISLLTCVIAFKVYGFTVRFILATVYLICSIIGFVVGRRYLWTVSYLSILLTEVPIICGILLVFVLEKEKVFSDDEMDFNISWLCNMITI